MARPKSVCGIIKNAPSFGKSDAATATAIAKPSGKVLAAAKACEPSARSILQQLVQIDSGTGDAAGLAAMGDLNASVEMVHAIAPAVGANLVATLTGAGRGRSRR